MITLTVDNSTSKIEGLDRPQHKKLSEILSYKIDSQAIYFSGGYRPNTRTLLGKNGDFPTGLLYLVIDYLKKNKIAYRTNDIRRVPQASPGLFKTKLPHSPYFEQKAAAEAAKALKRGIITAPTGCGKSIIAALIIEKLQLSTLVVVPSLELKRQLTDTLKAIFGDNKVGELKKKLPIAVENVDALDTSKDLFGYDCVIIDEFHHSGAKTYRKLNKHTFKNIYCKFGLTATPFRSQDNERLLLESVLSEVIYRIDYKTAVAKGYIVPIEAYYVELPKKEIEGNPTSWASMYSELVVNNKDRNDIIAAMIKDLHSAGSSTLCLVKEINHGKILSDLSGSSFAHGENEETPMLIKGLNDKKLTTLIGTTGVIGEGVDTKPCEFIIIAGLGKSKNSFMQQCGRGFRFFPGKDSCKVILFKDPSHKWTLAHFRAQCKFLLDEYGVKAVKL